MLYINLYSLNKYFIKKKDLFPFTLWNTTMFFLLINNNNNLCISLIKKQTVQSLIRKSSGLWAKFVGNSWYRSWIGHLKLGLINDAQDSYFLSISLFVFLILVQIFIQAVHTSQFIFYLNKLK